MAWILLIGSGAFEAVWATALSKSEGFTKLWPSVVFFAALIVSMGGLAYALREIPVGTGYAIWVAVGAVLTVVYAMVTKKLRLKTRSRNRRGPVLQGRRARRRAGTRPMRQSMSPRAGPL